MTLKDIVVEPTIRALLESNGRMDAGRGVSIGDGWKEIANECGYDTTRRTPAQEAYLDGYYSVPKV